MSQDVHYLVPHSWIYLDVKDAKGQPVTWALETTGHGGLQKVGVKREDVRPGAGGPATPQFGAPR